MNRAVKNELCYLLKWIRGSVLKKYWKSLGILSVRKSGNHDCPQPNENQDLNFTKTLTACFF